MPSSTSATVTKQMGKIERYRQELMPLFALALETGESVDLHAYLASNSNLPGPRGNLELASAFGDVVGDLTEENAGRLWDLCLEMTRIPVEVAGGNDPESFLSFCGTVALGAVGAISETYVEPALARLRVLARDSRWRIREGISFALSRLLASRPAKTLDALDDWVIGGDPLELRAVAAGVADPPLLRSNDVAERALSLHEQILTWVAAWPAASRKTEGFRVLRQGLAFTLSVVVAASPEAGFRLMYRWAPSPDRDIRWVLAQNLKKKRLTSTHPDEVQALIAVLQRDLV